MTMYEGSGHFPPIDARERWSARVLRLPGVRRELRGARARADRPRARRSRSTTRDPGGEQITVFAREVAEPDGRDKPFLVYLQGGPGFEAPRPTGNPRGPGWLDRALKEFRVLLLDQRGTGRSTPVTGRESAEYLTHFRADAIVRDAEALRDGARLRAVERARPELRRPVRPHLPLARARRACARRSITGGVPGIGTPVDDVYRATWERMIERNRRYYARFPEDRERMLALVERLEPRTCGCRTATG